MAKVLEAVDLFCGAGGTSSGLRNACRRLGLDVKLTAVNHWNLAIDTHSANHADADHLCADLESVDPHDVVPGGRLRLLVASPECTHFSVARGGKPVNNQKRAGARYVINWAEKIYIENILIENVREWQKWGPIHTNPSSKHYGRPIKAKEGEFFYSFIRDLELLDYVVDFRVLCAADYGAPTTRERFFLQAKKRVRGTKVAITWPDPTHKKPGSEDQTGLFADTRKPWRTAREIIDFNIKSRSVFDPKRKPLAPTTIARIWAGFDKWGGQGEPFKLALEMHLRDRGLNPDDVLNAKKRRKAETMNAQDGKMVVTMRNNVQARDLGEPVPAITAGGNHIGLAEGFMLGQQSGSAARPLEETVPTIATDGAIGLTEGMVIPMQRKQNATDASSPFPTVTATSSDFGLVQGEKFIIPQFGGQGARSVDKPLGTITTTSRGIGLVESDAKAFMMKLNHNEPRSYPLDQPFFTLTSEDTTGLVEPFIVTASHGHDGPSSHARRSHPIDQPMKTLTGSNDYGLVEGFVTTAGGAEGQGRTATGFDQPLGTVLTNDRRAIVESFAVPTNHGICDRSYSLDKPMPTITTVDALGVVQGEAQREDINFVAKYFGTGVTKDLDKPLDTVTSKDRFLLVEGKWVPVTTLDGKQFLVDIRFRMFQPKELAGAQSFDPDYKFEGSREDVVKQIGNAVPPALAEALIYNMLRPAERAGRLVREELAA